MILVLAAKETGIKEMLNIKDNNNGKKNRFILTSYNIVKFNLLKT